MKLNDIIRAVESGSLPLSAIKEPMRSIVARNVRERALIERQEQWEADSYDMNKHNIEERKYL